MLRTHPPASAARPSWPRQSRTPRVWKSVPYRTASDSPYAPRRDPGTALARWRGGLRTARKQRDTDAGSECILVPPGRNIAIRIAIVDEGKRHVDFFELEAPERAICTLSVFDASTIGATAPDSYAPASQKLFAVIGPVKEPLVLGHWCIKEVDATLLWDKVGRFAPRFERDRLRFGPPFFTNHSGARFSALLVFLLVPLNPQLLS